MTARRAAALALALVAGLAVPYTAAHADLDGPDDTLAMAAGPLQPGTSYDGRFVRADDVDHLAFDVEAGQTLHFDVQNTTSPCQSAYQTYCPIYGTLLDGAGQQLGGEGSSAGTGAVFPGDTDGIDWTFATGGRYYLVMDSAGDLPSYRVGFAPVVAPAPGTTTTTTTVTTTGGGKKGNGKGSATTTTSVVTGTVPTTATSPATPAAARVPALKVLGVNRVSSRGVVTARVRVGARLTSLTASVVPAGRTAPVAGRTTLRALAKGTYVVRVTLPASARARVRRGLLRPSLRLVGRPVAGGVVTLTRRVPA